MFPTLKAQRMLDLYPFFWCRARTSYVFNWRRTAVSKIHEGTAELLQVCISETRLPTALAKKLSMMLCLACLLVDALGPTSSGSSKKKSALGPTASGSSKVKKEIKKNLGPSSQSFFFFEIGVSLRRRWIKFSKSEKSEKKTIRLKRPLYYIIITMILLLLSYTLIEQCPEIPYLFPIIRVRKIHTL